jgi:hypothetical protein
MDTLRLVEKLRRSIREKQSAVVNALTSGKVDDFASYRYLRAKFEVYGQMEDELRHLLKETVENDEPSDSS